MSGPDGLRVIQLWVCLFVGPLCLVQWTVWINTGVAVPSSSEDEDERFVGGAGVGLSCMQCSHGYIQSGPPNTHKRCTLMNSNTFSTVTWFDQKTAQRAFLIFFPPRFIKTENIFHFILIDFMSSSPPCSDHTITSLRSLIKNIYSSLFRQTFTWVKIYTQLLKTALAKCFSLFTVCVLVARHIKQINCPGLSLSHPNSPCQYK